MLPIVVLPQADTDIDTFFFHITEDNEIAANQFLDRVEETLKLLSEFPKIAPRFVSEHPELYGTRWFPVKHFSKHLLFYIEDETQITLVRIFHKAQDISSILE